MNVILILFFSLKCFGQIRNYTTNKFTFITTSALREQGSRRNAVVSLYCNC